MGKKTKVGKQRRDKYYQLAKDTGFRSRSAFKLIQLNRKYEFLQKSQVLIDLCAAPGGWLQVAAQHMPVSRVIIGVDLVPIKPIHNVITVEDDITKNSCKQALKKHLQTWKADVVLHDGAPNVGKNWLHDAFQQAQLTLQALKLATEFLMKGGWFITKVFRSKDYHALLWVFRQFFKKVYATKPQASRNESAEIFVVCQSYIAPDKIDPKFLDSKYVFEEVDPEPKVKLNLMQPSKKKKKAEGYADGATLLFTSTPVSQFIISANYLEILNASTELVFDDDKMLNHELTSEEIKECCKDIKVLGKNELRLLLRWRKKMRDEFVKEEKEKIDSNNEVTHEELEEDEDAKIQREIEEMQMVEMQEKKRQKKKVLKQKKQLHDKMNLKMVIPDEEPIRDEDEELFKLAQMKSKTQLTQIEKGDLGNLDEFEGKNEYEDEGIKELNRKKRVRFEKDEKYLAGLYSDDEKESTDEEKDNLYAQQDIESEDEDDGDEDMDTSNPLLVDLDTGTAAMKQKRKMNMWFEKDAFEGLEKEDDEDFELDNITKHYEQKGQLLKKKTEVEKVEIEDEVGEVEEDEAESDSDSDAESDYDTDVDEEIEQANGGNIAISENKKSKKRKHLDVEGLALGSMLIQSRKRKRDLVDNAWNRYTFGEEDAPDWFKIEEEKHNKKQIPVTKEMMEEFRQRLKEINARPIGKVAEAKARKKKRTLRQMEKARKRAEAITDAIDMTDREKVQQIKTIYKKAVKTVNKKKEVAYVVSRKAFASKRAVRPAGLKGPYKVVDPRMKKDMRKNKMNEKKGGGKKGKGKPSGKKPSGKKSPGKKKSR